MNEAVLPTPGHRTSALVWVRWGGCLLLVLMVHAGALLWLRRAEPIAGPAPQEAVMLDLAPEPTAPPPAPAEPVPQAETPPEPVPLPVESPAETPPEPVQQGEPPPPEVPDITPPEQQAEAPLPPPPPVRPPPRPRPDVPKRVATPRPVTASPPPSAPPVSTPAGPAAAAPPGQTEAQMEATWQAKLLAHLARYKRFPPAAQRRGEQGTVLMRFIMARDGSVLAMTMVRGSGYADLDEEARAWMTRAQPLPAFPPEMIARQIELVVPLRFILN